jgi:hypothetical protein
MKNTWEVDTAPASACTSAWKGSTDRIENLPASKPPGSAAASGPAWRHPARTAASASRQQAETNECGRLEGGNEGFIEERLRTGS